MWVRYSTIELPAPPRERWRFLACRSGAYPHLSLAPTTPAAEESVGADGDDLSGHLGCLTITGTSGTVPQGVHTPHRWGVRPRSELWISPTSPCWSDLMERRRPRRVLPAGEVLGDAATSLRRSGGQERHRRRPGRRDK